MTAVHRLFTFNELLKTLISRPIAHNPASFNGQFVCVTPVGIVKKRRLCIPPRARIAGNHQS